ncbi:uncharacterized protein LOC105630401 [Jatropha curcas]|uniref:uncharacterized protein LOC105630401 n=1 Tax=Jatropha curcas TaxID=180498 RepID=UPI0018931324|nr:uncharacterized protein LOC105630401 [Jatropha curcas]
MLKPPLPSYAELVSQLQNHDQRRNLFSNHTDMSASSLTHHMAFFGQQQQRPQLNHSGYRGSSQKFTSNGRGFQAQQRRDLSAANSQRRPPPPGERRMTSAEREQYRDQQCQYCGVMGHVAKICWWVPKKSTQQNEIPQALAALTLDTSVTDTEWTTDTAASNHMTATGNRTASDQRETQGDALFYLITRIIFFLIRLNSGTAENLASTPRTSSFFRLILLTFPFQILVPPPQISALVRVNGEIRVIVILGEKRVETLGQI